MWFSVLFSFPTNNLQRHLPSHHPRCEYRLTELNRTSRLATPPWPLPSSVPPPISSGYPSASRRSALHPYRQAVHVPSHLVTIRRHLRDTLLASDDFARARIVYIFTDNRTELSFLIFSLSLNFYIWEGLLPSTTEKLIFAMPFHLWSFFDR